VKKEQMKCARCIYVDTSVSPKCNRKFPATPINFINQNWCGEGMWIDPDPDTKTTVLIEYFEAEDLRKPPAAPEPPKVPVRAMPPIPHDFEWAMFMLKKGSKIQRATWNPEEHIMEEQRAYGARQFIKRIVIRRKIGGFAETWDPHHGDITANDWKTFDQPETRPAAERSAPAIHSHEEADSFCHD